MENDDYWLALAVYDQFRGVPVRKLIAREYLEIKSMDRADQALFIRLGSLFFQGRSWRKFAGDSAEVQDENLTMTQRHELERFRSVRGLVGAATIRLLDDDDSMSPITRDATVERLETMGFLDGDYKI